MHRVEIPIAVVHSGSSGAVLVIAASSGGYVAARGNGNTNNAGGVADQTMGVR